MPRRHVPKTKPQHKAGAEGCGRAALAVLGAVKAGVANGSWAGCRRWSSCARSPHREELPASAAAQRTRVGGLQHERTESGHERRRSIGPDASVASPQPEWSRRAVRTSPFRRVVRDQDLVPSKHMGAILGGRQAGQAALLEPCPRGERPGVCTHQRNGPGAMPRTAVRVSVPERRDAYGTCYMPSRRHRSFRRLCREVQAGAAAVFPIREPWSPRKQIGRV
jgi:hypothetical protein